MLKGFCTYCGFDATERDHVTPIAWDGVNHKQVKTTRRNTVPCCKACNKLLNNTYTVSIKQRADSVYRKLRYERPVGKPTRSVMFSWELDELGPQLKGRILELRTKRKIEYERWELRLEFAKRVSRKSFSISEAWAANDLGLNILEFGSKYL